MDFNKTLVEYKRSGGYYSQADDYKKRPASMRDESDKESDNHWTVYKKKKDTKEEWKFVKQFKHNEKDQAQAYSKAYNNKSETHEFKTVETA